MENTVFLIIIIIIIGNYLLARILGYLNSTYWSSELPDDLKDIYDADDYRKSQEYEKTKHKFGLLVSGISLLVILLVLFFDGFALLDNFLRQYITNPVWLALAFFGILGLASDILTTPFDLYTTFVIEEKFGFNRTTPKIYILDKIKSWVLGILIGGGILALIVWIYGISGQWFWLLAWGLLTVFSLFMSLFYSNIIVPLFNKQTPLEDGELRDEINNFAMAQEFKMKDVYVIDGSKRSSKANAYFTGFGPKKRIVLYDTLIQDHSTKELVAVLAHEIGHYKMKHTIKGLIISIIQTGLMLFLLSLFLEYEVFSLALGAGEKSFHMGILAFGLMYAPVSLLLSLFHNILSRKHEFQADTFAGERYDAMALKQALKKLSVKNLSNLRPHPAYVFFYYSHPPLLKRLENLDGVGFEKA